MLQVYPSQINRKRESHKHSRMLLLLNRIYMEGGSGRRRGKREREKERVGETCKDII